MKQSSSAISLSQLEIYNDEQSWLKFKTDISEIALKEVINCRKTSLNKFFKSDNSVVTSLDKNIQYKIMLYLKQQFPDFSILSEELAEIEQYAILKEMQMGQTVWILDPLDGSSNFVNNIPFYALSLALCMQGELVLGLVINLAHNEVFSARKAKGLEINHRPTVIDSDKNLDLNKRNAAINIQRLDKNIISSLFANKRFRSLRILGSATLEWCYLACNRVSFYLDKNQKIWDYAAGLVILREAGGMAVDLEKNNLFKFDLKSEIIIATSDKKIMSYWLQDVSNALKSAYKN